MWFWQDIQYGLRGMRRSPGFTAAAVLSLSLGIGANTAIFSVFDRLMLRALPVTDPERLVTFREAGETATESYPTYQRLRDGTDGFSSMAAVCDLDRSNLTVNGIGDGMGHPGEEPGVVRVGLVSGNYFATLGVTAALGRTLTAEDDRVPGGHPVTAISYAFWKRRFRQAPDVLGRTLSLNGTTYTVLGVAKPGFSGDLVGHPTDLWIPLAMQSQVVLERPGLLTNANPPWLRIIARLRPGVSLPQAQAPLDVVYRRALAERLNLTPAMMREGERAHLEVQPASRGFSPDRQIFAQPLAILMIVVGLVLLIACANIANLLLARSQARQREMAVRLALGARSGRILRQLLTESLLLAALGGGSSLVVAVWGAGALEAMVAAGPEPVKLDLQVDGRILAFTGVLCLFTGVLFGMAPAWRGSQASLTPSLNRRGAHSGGRRGFGLGGLLVVSQVAGSLLLLTGAGLFVQTLRNLKSQELGFDRERVLLVWTAPGHAGLEGKKLAALFAAVQERISALPGVLSASPSAFGLMGGDGGGSPVKVQGDIARSPDDSRSEWNQVGPRFFETVGTPLLLGRDFTGRDTESAPHVAIVNETFARAYFGARNPLGQRFGMRRDTGYPWEIVGVVKDARYHTLRDRDRKMIYLPYGQDVTHLFGNMCLMVRSAGNTPGYAPGLAARIREELRGVDRNLPVLSMQTMAEQLDQSLTQERLIAALCGFFAALALLLACLGLFGVMSYTAARRTHEIGIRLALGATPGAVLAMVLREGLMRVAAGIAIGVPATLAATRLITSSLFGVGAADPPTLIAAAFLMVAVAAFAGFLPARRASRVDPMVALRCD
jgi:predicted permease